MKLAGEYDREIKLFVDGMRYKLHANRHKGKWENLSSKDAFKHLEAEVKELKDAIEVEDEDRNLMNVLQEAVDVANMAMILFNIELSSANKTLDLDEKFEEAGPTWSWRDGPLEEYNKYFQSLDMFLPREIWAHHRVGGIIYLIGGYDHCSPSKEWVAMVYENCNIYRLMVGKRSETISKMSKKSKLDTENYETEFGSVSGAMEICTLNFYKEGLNGKVLHEMEGIDYNVKTEGGKDED